MSIAEEIWEWVQQGAWDPRDERQLVDWIERIEKLEQQTEPDTCEEWLAMMETSE